MRAHGLWSWGNHICQSLLKGWFREMLILWFFSLPPGCKPNGLWMGSPSTKMADEVKLTLCLEVARVSKGEHWQHCLQMIFSVGVGTELSTLPLSPPPTTSGPLTKGSKTFWGHGDSTPHSSLQPSEEHYPPSTHGIHYSTMFFYHNMTSPLCRERNLCLLEFWNICLWSKGIQENLHTERGVPNFRSFYRTWPTFWQNRDVNSMPSGNQLHFCTESL